MKKWYAVYTKPSFEKKVINAFTKRGLEIYFPQVLPKKLLQDDKKAFYEPLFPLLVFVRLSEDKHEFLLQVPGVVSLFYWLSKPAIIKNSEIEMMQRFLHQHPRVQAQKIAVDYKATVQVINESLEDKDKLTVIEGNICKLILPSLGYQLVAEIETKGIRSEKKSFNYSTKLSNNLALS